MATVDTRRVRNTGMGKAQFSSFRGGAKMGRMGVGIQVFGVMEAIRKLMLVGSVAGRATGYLVFASAKRVEKSAKEIVHSPSNPGTMGPRTGNLRDGIMAEKVDKYQWAVTASSVRGGSDREYAAYEEKGTSKAPSHPYMKPALNGDVPRVVGDLKQLAVTLERL